MPYQGADNVTVPGPWNLEFHHCQQEKTPSTLLQSLQNLKDIPEYANFSGVVIYRKNVFLKKNLPAYLNLGQVYNISSVTVNGKDAGIKWYGKHIYNIAGLVQEGENEFEIHVITLMGNYMKSLKDNPVAQYWTNLERKNQPVISMGLVGPVRLYRRINI